MSFDQLLTIPEQDEWVYSDGKSTTCVSFILAMYKEAGVFAPFTESIQVTEFTVSAQVPYLPVIVAIEKVLFFSVHAFLHLRQFRTSRLNIRYIMWKDRRAFFWLIDPVSSVLNYLLPQIRDAYMLKIFEDDRTRLPSWCRTEADKPPFCQILGEYRMELPEYNTIEPYAKMNENCPSLPPTYKRPSRCWHETAASDSGV